MPEPNIMDSLWEWTAALPARTQTTNGASGSSTTLLQLARAADSAAILDSEEAKQLLKPYQELLNTAQLDTLDLSRPYPASTTIAATSTILVASAALNAFVQANWTGPELAFTSTELLFGKGTAESELLQHASVNALSWRGEPAYHLCQEAFLLLFAKHTLQTLAASSSLSQDEAGLAAWWRLRTALVHVRVLDEPVPFDAEILNPADKALHYLHSKTAAFWPDVQARLQLERGLSMQHANQDRDAAGKYVEAAKLHGFEFLLSGALGKRTKFQREDKTQLVLLARSRADVVAAEEALRKDEKTKAAIAAADSKVPKVTVDDPERSGWRAGAKAHQDSSMPSNLELNDDTLLEQTHFTSTASTSVEAALNEMDPQEQPALSPFDQSILLALSFNIRNTSPTHGLTTEQISAFVSRVLLHPMNWSVYTMALLLRSRLEATRTRTVERSVLQLQALIDQMPTADSSRQERLRLFYDLDLPPKWELQAELAKRYAGLGVTRSALEIYQAVEMWEEVVQCLYNLGRQEEGIEVVRDLLEGRKMEASESLARRKQGDAAPSSCAKARMNSAREAKLWCLLGDLETEHSIEHYQKAWQVSSQSSARAARALGGIYFARQDYQGTVDWLRSALSLNPLFMKTWFILGCAYMRLERWEEGATCFRRCTNLDEEDGESWNNLASCYLQMGGPGACSEPSVVSKSEGPTSLPTLDGQMETIEGLTLDDEEEQGGAGRKADAHFALRRLAHRALGQSLKFSRESWKVWYNYMVVSVDVGELSEAVRALGTAVELRTAKAHSEREKVESIDYEVLDRLVHAVTRSSAATDEVLGTVSADDPNYGGNLLRAIELLFEKTLLTRVSASAHMWRTYAGLQLWKGAYRTCLEARLQAWKSSGGDSSDESYATEKKQWLEGIHDLTDLVELMENLGPKPAQSSIANNADAIRRDGDGQQQQQAEANQEEAMKDWKFKARSLIRGYMSRTKDSFGDENEWSQLEELKESLR